MFIKRLPRFEYHTPATVADALELMAKYGNKASVFAGGTDLFVSMKKREKVPEHLINLKGIPGLKGIRFDEKEGITIGALTTIAELERSTLVRNKCHPL
jgi:carbon-monoxide dehydrogenase medium subunit